MRCNQESHRSLFLQYATCHLAYAVAATAGVRPEREDIDLSK
jgi:hypothetical protein